MHSVEEIVKEIQYVLAPAVMVSSSALLLLSFHNKFSSLASRFRALKQELRLLREKREKTDYEKARLKTLEVQVEHLMKRATLVKNSILQTYLAIICFAGTSVLIFLNAFVFANGLFYLIIAAFILGMVLLLAVSVSMIRETVIFYRVISFEKES